MSLRRITTAVVAAGLVASGSAGSAFATAPDRSTETLDFTLDNHPYYSAECGFPVSLHVWGEFLVRTWNDDAGNPVREIRHYNFRSTTSANGKSVNGRSVGPETAVFNPDGSVTVHLRGIVNRVVPGAGTVKLSWGSGIVIWPADGGDEIIVEPTGGPESLQPLCDYLAP
jgi:hypothetical protein